VTISLARSLDIVRTFFRLFERIQSAAFVTVAAGFHASCALVAYARRVSVRARTEPMHRRVGVRIRIKLVSDRTMNQTRERERERERSSGKSHGSDTSACDVSAPSNRPSHGALPPSLGPVEFDQPVWPICLFSLLPAFAFAFAFAASFEFPFLATIRDAAFRAFLFLWIPFPWI